jgi:hypothetical protein
MGRGDWLGHAQFARARVHGAIDIFGRYPGEHHDVAGD